MTAEEAIKKMAEVKFKTPVSESCPDYEHEYYRLIELVKQLKCENGELKETVLGMCKWLFLRKE